MQRLPAADEDTPGNAAQRSGHERAHIRRLVEYLARKGVHLVTATGQDGQRRTLMVRAPAGALTVADRAAIRLYAPSLLETLCSGEDLTASDCAGGALTAAPAAGTDRASESASENAGEGGTRNSQNPHNATQTPAVAEGAGGRAEEKQAEKSRPAWLAPAWAASRGELVACRRGGGYTVRHDHERGDTLSAPPRGAQRTAAGRTALERQRDQTALRLFAADPRMRCPGCATWVPLQPDPRWAHCEHRFIGDCPACELPVCRVYRLDGRRL